MKDPVTIPPSMTVREVLKLKRAHKISGLPVVERRACRRASSPTATCASRPTWTSRCKQHHDAARALGYGEGRRCSCEEAMRLMHKHRLERVLVVNGEFHLRGLITVKDILKSSEHPNACKDELGRLRVGAAIGVGEGTEERAAALVEAGVRRARGGHRPRSRAGRAGPRASGSSATFPQSR